MQLLSGVLYYMLLLIARGLSTHNFLKQLSIRKYDLQFQPTLLRLILFFGNIEQQQFRRVGVTEKWI